MKKYAITVVSATLIEINKPLTLHEIAQAVNLEPSLIVRMVEQQLLNPIGGENPNEWRFDSECLRRARIAASFYHDLGMNLTGISLALDMLDEIKKLKQRISTLERYFR